MKVVTQDRPKHNAIGLECIPMEVFYELSH